MNFSLFLRPVVFSLLCVGLASAAQAASVAAVQGKVSVQRDGKTLPAKAGMQLRMGDTLTSAVQGEAMLRLDDGGGLAVRSDSAIELKRLPTKTLSASQQQTIRLVQGGLRFVSSKLTEQHKTEFETSTATIGIRGTDVEIAVSAVAVADNNPGTYLKVNSGAAVLIANDGAQVEVAPGEQAFGGEPELTPRGAGGVRRLSARKVQTQANQVFKASRLDALFK